MPSEHKLKPEHISVTEADLGSAQPLGRFFFLPGSPGRAKEIAEHFEERRAFPSERGHDVYVGKLRGAKATVDVGVVATGMGCPSVDIIVTELIYLGVRCLLRVGTCGSLQPSRVKGKDVVIASGAVRDEAASLSYAPLEFPAMASLPMVQAAEQAAAALGLSTFVHTGIVHTKDSLYGREFGHGPRADKNRAYGELLRRLGVVASEMEAAHLFILAQAYAAERAHPIHAGCVLAVIGDDTHGFGSSDTKQVGVKRAIELSLATATTFLAT